MLSVGFHGTFFRTAISTLARTQLPPWPLFSEGLPSVPSPMLLQLLLCRIYLFSKRVSWLRTLQRYDWRGLFLTYRQIGQAHGNHSHPTMDRR